MCYILGMPRAPLLLALLLAACSDDPGATLYQAMGCRQCHGTEGDGGTLAPPLERLAENWTREEIAEYLVDPLTVVEADPRLSELKLLYDGKQMPAMTLPVEDRLLLADFVLALSASKAGQRAGVRPE